VKTIFVVRANEQWLWSVDWSPGISHEINFILGMDLELFYSIKRQSSKDVYFLDNFFSVLNDILHP
jgi:hypothetical protein